MHLSRWFLLFFYDGKIVDKYNFMEDWTKDFERNGTVFMVGEMSPNLMAQGISPAAMSILDLPKIEEVRKTLFEMKKEQDKDKKVIKLSDYRF